MNRLGLGVDTTRGVSMTSLPASLFSVAGSRGLFYDFSDYNTLFTDTAGTSRITGTGQSLALVLDKSQGLVLGPELGNAAQINKREATDGTVSRSGGVITFVAAASGLSTAVSQEITGLVIGRTYRFAGRMRRTAGSTAVSPQIRTASGGGGTLIASGPSIGADWADFSFLWQATQTSAFFSYLAGNNQTIEIQEASHSVRELPGNHATQGTAGSQPLTVTFDAGYRGIQTDGVDDFLQTAAIDFSNSDKMTVVAGVRKLSDAALGALMEIGVGGNPGTVSLGAPGSAGATYRFLSQGTIGNAALSAASFPAPDTAVLTGIGDISGDSVILRRNGVQVAQNTADQGTGNYSNAPVYLFRRGGTTLPANVICTFMLVINRTLTTGELVALEAYANSRTGAY